MPTRQPMFKLDAERWLLDFKRPLPFPDPVSLMGGTMPEPEHEQPAEVVRIPVADFRRLLGRLLERYDPVRVAVARGFMDAATNWTVG